MLDAYIIDAIRQEELERERAYDRRRAYAELPIVERRQPERPAYIVPEMGDPIVIPLVPEPRIEEDAA